MGAHTLTKMHMAKSHSTVAWATARQPARVNVCQWEQALSNNADVIAQHQVITRGGERMRYRGAPPRFWISAASAFACSCTPCQDRIHTLSRGRAASDVCVQV